MLASVAFWYEIGPEKGSCHIIYVTSWNSLYSLFKVVLSFSVALNICWQSEWNISLLNSRRFRFKASLVFLAQWLKWKGVYNMNANDLYFYEVVLNFNLPHIWKMLMSWRKINTGDVKRILHINHVSFIKQSPKLKLKAKMSAYTMTKTAENILRSRVVSYY